MEPGARQIPISLHSAQRELHDLGDFFFAQTAEELQFDDAALALIELSQRRLPGARRMSGGGASSRPHSWLTVADTM